MTENSPHMPLGETRYYGFKRFLRNSINWRIMYTEHGDRFAARIKKNRGAGFVFLAWIAALLFGVVIFAIYFMGGGGFFYMVPGIGVIPFELPILIASATFLIVMWRAGASSKFFYRITIDADRVTITDGMKKPIMDADKRHVGLFNTKGNPLHGWQLFTNHGGMVVTLHDLKSCNDEVAATIVGFLNAAMNRVRQSQDGQITAGSGDNAVIIAPASATDDAAAKQDAEDDKDLRV